MMAIFPMAILEISLQAINTKYLISAFSIYEGSRPEIGLKPRLRTEE